MNQASISPQNKRLTLIPFHSTFLGCFLKRHLRVELNFLTIPSVWEWYRDILIWCIPVQSQNCLIIVDTRLVPLSESTSLGSLSLDVTCIKHSMMVSDVILHNGNAIGHLVVVVHYYKYVLINRSLT